MERSAIDLGRLGRKGPEIFRSQNLTMAICGGIIVKKLGKRVSKEVYYATRFWGKLYPIIDEKKMICWVVTRWIDTPLLKLMM